MAQFNFRLFLRPTAIGKAIIERLSADGAERQADSRRWIELGYALEQAGFRLDGTTLYLGGRPFAAEQTPTIQVPASAAEPTAARAAAQQGVASAVEPVSVGHRLVAASADAASSQTVAHAQAPASAAPRPAQSAPSRPASPVLAAPPPPPRSAADDDEMANNLRGLSA